MVFNLPALQWLTMLLFLECLMKSLTSRNDLVNYFVENIFLIYFLDKGFEPRISRSVYEHITTSLSRRLVNKIINYQLGIHTNISKLYCSVGLELF